MILKSLKINPIIFKRFFIRKKANSNNDFVLTLMFVILIALSSAMIIRTSFEIVKFQDKIEEFNKNEWNKVFQLFLKDCFVLTSEDAQYVGNSRVPLRVKTYLDSLDESENIAYNEIYDMYPTPIKIKSANGVIPKVQAYLLGKDYKFIVDHLAESFPGEDFTDKPYLFLEESLIPYLKVQENDLVLVKDAFSEGSKYSTLLRVKILKQSSRIKCFMFKDYLLSQGEGENKKVKFAFDNLDQALTFAFKDLFLNWTTLEYPYYLNAEGITFLGISDMNNELRDFLLPAKAIPQFADINKIDMLFTDSKANSVQYSFSLYRNTLSIIDLNSFRDIAGEKLEDIVKVEEIKKIPQLQNISVQIDFDRNFSYSGEVQLKQEEIFKFIPMAKGVDIDYIPQQRKQIFDNIFFYYDKFADVELTTKIMQKFDSLNIRWDSGRWKTIIDLNNSLEAGKKNIKLLLVVNIFVIMFFLIIKFYLRLKIEFHSIGTLRCFGYSITEISRVYTLGYFLLIVAGFFIGIFPTSYIMGILSGLTKHEVLRAYEYLLLNPLNYASIFFLILMFLTSLVVNIILRNFIKHDNIYELIKFEN